MKLQAFGPSDPKACNLKPRSAPKSTPAQWLGRFFTADKPALLQGQLVSAANLNVQAATLRQEVDSFLANIRSSR